MNHMFDAAVEELVTNAVEHNDDERLRVAVTAARAEHGMAELRVADDGPGIPGHVPRILARREHDQVDHLEGLGLWFVYWTVAESGGELDMGESDLGGACVRIRVPRTTSVTACG